MLRSKCPFSLAGETGLPDRIGIVDLSNPGDQAVFDREVLRDAEVPEYKHAAAGGCGKPPPRSARLRSLRPYRAIYGYD